jgi:hypothetical protein
LNGATASNTSKPMAEHEARQPSVRMIDCSHGSYTMAPTPTPEKAIPIASARRRTNQFGRNCECTV